jgi:hypothetical protein
MIGWMDDWQAALERARVEDRGVFLFLHAPT